MAYVDRVTVHHHPSSHRDAPARRQAAIWRSRLLTAVMRLPAADVAGVPTVVIARTDAPCPDALTEAAA